MASKTNKALREGFDRLKKTFEKVIRQQKDNTSPQLALQPVRSRPPGLVSRGREIKNF